jgi:hypothetical protein
MIGDHIRTLKAGRWTHAIDCGDETVILLAEEAAQLPRVRRSYRPEFVSGADTVEIVRHRERTFPAEEVVARAYSRVSDPSLASMFRDSEAFAEWCTTGRLPSAPPSVAVAVPGVAANGSPPPGSTPSARQEPRAAAGAKRGAGPKPVAKPKPKPPAKAKAKATANAKARAKPARAAKAARKAKPAAKAKRAAARQTARPGRRRGRR